MNTDTTTYTFLRNVVLAFIALFLFTSAFLRAQTSPFAGGSGTKADPYQVATAVQLDSIRHYLASHFKQTANIDLNITPYNSGSGWLPIQDLTGSYDGGGHTISNLMINRPSTSYVGLFGSVNKATLRNIALKNSTVTGSVYVGTLVGVTRGASVIRGNHSSNGIIVAASLVGGLVGHARNGSHIQESYTMGGKMTLSHGHAGGLVGRADTTTIVTSYSTGMEISVTHNAGGLVGMLYGSGASITNSYSINRVSGRSPGGLVGVSSKAKISTSYSASVALSQLSLPWSGLVGSLSETIVVNSYYNSDSTAAGQGKSPGLNTTQMRHQASYTGWDFTNTWLINEGVAFPGFQPFPVTSGFFDRGSGIKADPYQVVTAAQLDSVRHHLSSHFIQTADIDLNVAPYNTGQGWVPIPDFTGSYDGDGFTISDLMINRPATDTVGLFATVKGGTLTKLTLSGPSVTGKNVVSALAGYVSKATLKNIAVTNPKLTGSAHIGALIGDSRNNSVIRESHASGGSIQATGIAGGLVGNMWSGTITASYSTGMEINSNTSPGGLVGRAQNGTVITTSYSIGMKISGSGAAGLVGYAGNIQLENSYAINRVFPGTIIGGGLVTSTHNSTIINSYSASVVTGAKGAGLVAAAGGNTTITNSYYNSDSTSAATSNGTGLTTAQMSQQVSFTGWDFDTTWYIQEGINFPGLQLSLVRDGFFAGGSGTVGDPFQIATANQLNNVRLLPVAHFKQTADIDLGVAPYNTGDGWVPIAQFNGTFNGNGHTISNLFVNPAVNQPPPVIDNLGLFARVGTNAITATLENMTLINPFVTNGDNVGALAGVLGSAHLTNVHVVGGSVTSVSSDPLRSFGSTNVGGLAGVGAISILRGTDLLSITKSSTVEMTITSTSSLHNTTAGGLVGWLNTNSTISDSYTANKVRGGKDAGGLVGLFWGIITNSYSSSNVDHGSSGVAGVQGTEKTGGLVGDSFRGWSGIVTINNSYFNYDSTSSKPSTNNIYGDSLNTTQMRQQASYTGWDFTNTWRINEGVASPGFWFFSYTNGVFPGGLGTQAYPYQVATAAQLDNVRHYLSSHFKQTADIDLNAAPYNTGQGWVPIGIPTQYFGDPGINFTGSFDGGNHTISNLMINRNNTKGVGLFGSVLGATLKNMTLTNPVVTGNQQVAALAGYVYGDVTWGVADPPGQALLRNIVVTNPKVTGYSDVGALVGTMGDGGESESETVIRDSYASGGSIKATSNNAGGLAGSMWGGTITASYSTGMEINATVTGAGGVAGKMDYATITASYSTGMKISSPGAGGLVGIVYHRARIENCYAINHVTGSLSGGLFGLASSTTITTSYSASVATGSNSAGLVAAAAGNTAITNSYYNSDSTSTATAYGTPLTTAQMKQKSSFTGFDFDQTWFIHQGVGFPDLHIGSNAKASSSHFAETVPGDEEDSDLPTVVELQQNYPNPFNPVTTINYSIPEQSRVRLEVFDVLGRKVATLLDGENKTAGRYSVRFDARNLASGMYIYRLQAGNKTITKKLTLIK